jgi:hypothetical protein
MTLQIFRFLIFSIAVFFARCELFGQISLDNNGSTRATGYDMQSKIVSVARGGKLYTYFTYLQNTDLTKTIDLGNGTRESPIFNIVIAEVENGRTGPVVANKLIVAQYWETFLDNNDFPAPHGGASMVLDADGFLHIVYSFHYGSLYHINSDRSLKEMPLSFSTSPQWINSGKWTYPIIKADGDGRLHVAGSFDGDNDNGNNARQVGYVQGNLTFSNGTKLASWPLVFDVRDPLKKYTATYQARYNVMMNVDARDNIQVFAPDQASFEHMLQYGFLNYRHYARNTGEEHFSLVALHAYENDPNMFEQGWGNVEFDELDDPHLLVQFTDYFYFESTKDQPCTYLKKNFKHVFRKNGVWGFAEESAPAGKDAHSSKLRIEDAGEIYIILQASDRYSNCSSSATPSIIYVGAKSSQDSKSHFKYTPITSDGASTKWYPTIEENGKFDFQNKNWFYTMWQDAVWYWLANEVRIKKVIPQKDLTFSQKTFGGVNDYITSEYIQTTDTVEIPSTASVRLRSKSIKLRSGFRARNGSFLNVVADTMVCVTNTCIDPVHSLNGGRTKKGDVISTYSPHSIKHEEKETNVYPNPTNGKFWISNDSGANLEVSVTDVLGKQILSLNSFEYKIELDISRKQPGIYIVEIKGKGKYYVKRLVKM